MSYYPTTLADRQRLGDELTATGLQPTQDRQHFSRDKIDRMAEAMMDGTFDWNRANLQPVILGPDDEVLGGHHRVVAAHLARIDLTAIPGPRPQIQTMPRCFRPICDWHDVLPDVP